MMKEEEEEEEEEEGRSIWRYMNKYGGEIDGQCSACDGG